METKQHMCNAVCMQQYFLGQMLEKFTDKQHIPIGCPCLSSKAVSRQAVSLTHAEKNLTSVTLYNYINSGT